MIASASEAGISPAAFWKLTPWQLGNALKGYQSRIERYLEIAAWHFANVNNLVAKKKIRNPRQLLRPQAFINPTDYPTVEAFQQAVERKRAENKEKGR